MKKFRQILLLAALLVLAGCAKTNEPPDEISITPSESSTTENSTSSESTVIELPPEPLGGETEAVIGRIAVSEKNSAVSTPPEFSVDEENSQITLEVTYSEYIDLLTLKNCLLDIEIEGGICELDGAVNPNGTVDLTDEVFLNVFDENGGKKRYAITANRTVHDLPIVNIVLENLDDPSTIQRDTYKNFEFYIDNTGDTSYPETEILSGKIKGRGYSSWRWNKKPYRIKLDEKASIMGLQGNKDWILLSNYADKSLIRNTVAYDMGRELGSFVWTPTQIPVDLFINGEYQGVYGIGEQREIAKSRINIDESSDPDRGFLLEVGGANGTNPVNGVDYFHTKSSSVFFIAFDDPKPDELTEEQRKFIIDYVNAADAAIVAGEGYEEYIDVQSFCDWIIMHELTCNLDSCFRRSCFMTKNKGGKLMMGPIWDFDLAFGNFDMDNTNYNTWFTNGTTGSDPYIRVNWCNYLMKDEEFRAALKARWFEVRDKLLDRAQKSIDENKAKVSASQEENFKVWDIWGIKAGYQSWASYNANTYELQIKYLEDFLAKRAAWIDANI